MENWKFVNSFFSLPLSRARRPLSKSIREGEHVNIKFHFINNRMEIRLADWNFSLSPSVSEGVGHEKWKKRNSFKVSREKNFSCGQGKICFAHVSTTDMRERKRNRTHNKLDTISVVFHCSKPAAICARLSHMFDR